MKAFGINQYGSSKVLSELNVDVPTVSSDEVLVKTEAFAINPLDVAIREGRFKGSVVLLFPMILGTDAVGTVVKVGSKVENYHVGDEIIAHAGYGTYAEYFSISIKHIGLRPKEYDLYQAAGLPLSGITAYNVLIHSAQARSGQTIAIFGASGGVGSMILQMAKVYGLNAIGIDRPQTKAYVLSLGASKFISIGDDSTTKQLRDSVDIVVDASNRGLSTNIGIDLLKAHGAYVTLTELPKVVSNEKAINFKQFTSGVFYSDSDAFAAITLMIKNGLLHTRIDEILNFNLDDIRKGQDYVATGKHDGKVIVKI